MTGLNLQLDSSVIDPLIRQVVAETIAQLEAVRASHASSDAPFRQVNGAVDNQPEWARQLFERLGKVEAMLGVLIERQQVREFYAVEEFARIVGRAEFTCREWCRHGRINAEKKASGRGAYAGWAISHSELLRFQREGLLPLNRPPR
jgi:hypothetical protein